ncbi:MAG TPA: pyridoxamine 5'-phosphate oxidase family protein [Acidobacteriota bacterium]|nr:pyridoxamine 5'-phosphate oxidase family protein [Acidobacteriota bacterium]
MDELEARKLALDLMKTSPAVYLSTIDDQGFPQIRAMINLRNAKQYPSLVELLSNHEKDFLIYISTNTSSNKARQIQQNPRVAVYYCLPEQWRGLMLGGEAEALDDIELKRKIYQEGWEVYFPTGPGDPDFTLFRLKPVVAKYYQSLDVCEFGFEGEQ